MTDLNAATVGITTQGSAQYVQDVENSMEDFHELIEIINEVRAHTGMQFSIRQRSNVASGNIEFAITVLSATYDMTNCREAIGFLEGFQAYHMLKKVN